MTKLKFDCAIIGDIFYDVNLKLDDELVKDGVSYCKELKFLPGGAGNLAVALSKLGLKVCLIGKAGKDEFGRLYVEDLKTNVVEPFVFYDNTFATGIAISQVDHSGERSFIVYRGANNKLNRYEVSNTLQAIDYKYLYISGYSLVENPQADAIVYAAKLANAKGKKIIFDPNAFNLVYSRRECFNELIKLSDIICPNADEVSAFTDKKNINEAIVEFCKLTKSAFIKLGKKGCVLIHNNKIVYVPGFSCHIVDSTGAGDAFTSAVIYGLATKLKYKEIAYFANWFASKKVQSLGARSFPSILEINNFFQSLSS